MSKDLPPSRTAEQFVVRFPEGMRDQIADAAKANNRSMNAEIVARLQTSFAPRNGGSAGFGLFASGSGGNSQISEMTRAASQINELQGQRNTMAIVLNALGGQEQGEQVSLIKRQMEALDLQIASLVQIIQSLRTADPQ